MTVKSSRPGSRAGGWSLAPAHDGLYFVLRTLHARRQ
jgi:hypothetical protein